MRGPRPSKKTECLSTSRADFLFFVDRFLCNWAGYKNAVFLGNYLRAYGTPFSLWKRRGSPITKNNFLLLFSSGTSVKHTSAFWRNGQNRMHPMNIWPLSGTPFFWRWNWSQGAIRLAKLRRHPALASFSPVYCTPAVATFLQEGTRLPHLLPESGRKHAGSPVNGPTHHRPHPQYFCTRHVDAHNFSHSLSLTHTTITHVSEKNADLTWHV